MHKFFGLLLIWLMVTGIGESRAQHHYVFFNRDRERIAETTFLETRAFEGAQLKYTWRELEPEPDRYDFSMIQHDLDFLAAQGKKIFIQLQDVSFDTSIINVPSYLLEDSKYHGGVAMQYEFEGDAEDQAVPAGWVAMRWDPAVQERLHKLFEVLGKQFDSKIEGINLPESAVEFGVSGRLFPEGFTFDLFRDAVITNMKALKKAFPKSVAMQYANFMPGEWLPWNDRGYFRSVYRTAAEHDIGVGGPDLLPYKKGQMNNSYPFIKARENNIPAGIAVQWGNYAHVNPKTGNQVTIQELLDFAKDYLKVDYIFWGTQEPYYSQALIPFLAKSR